MKPKNIECCILLNYQSRQNCTTMMQNLWGSIFKQCWIATLQCWVQQTSHHAKYIFTFSNPNLYFQVCNLGILSEEPTPNVLMGRFGYIFYKWKCFFALAKNIQCSSSESKYIWIILTWSRKESWLAYFLAAEKSHLTLSFPLQNQNSNFQGWSDCGAN